MTCEEAGEMISVLLDGELAVPDIARIQHHLVDCEPCRAAHASETWLHSLLAAGVLSEEPPDSLRRRVRERIADEAAASLGRTRRWRRALLPALIGGGLFTLAVLLVLIHLERRGTRDSPILVAPVGASVATVAGRPAAQVLYAGGGLGPPLLRIAPRSGVVRARPEPSAAMMYRQRIPSPPPEGLIEHTRAAAAAVAANRMPAAVEEDRIWAHLFAHSAASS